MNKAKKGKGILEIPLYLRVIALIMAIAMVISVITITNTRDKVKAADLPSAPGTYVTAVQDMYSGDYTVSIPATGAHVILYSGSDKIGTFEENVLYEIVEIYKKKSDVPSGYETDPDYVRVAPGDAKPDKDVYEIYPLKAKLTRTVKWFVGTDEAAYNTSKNWYYVESAATAKTASLNEIDVFSDFTDNDDNAIPEEVANLLQDADKKQTITGMATVEVSAYAPSDISLNIDQANKIVQITDPDSSRASTKTHFEVGYSVYLLYKDGASVGGTITSLDSLMGYINNDKTTAGDGVYKVKKITEISSNAWEYAFSEHEFTRNFYVVKSFTAGGVTGDMSNLTVNVPSSGKANPKNDIDVTLETDKDYTSCTVSPDNAGGSPVTVNGNKITLPGSISNNALSPKTYTITVKQKDAAAGAPEAVDVITVNIYYGDGTPKISIDDDNPAVVAEKELTIKASAEVVSQDSGAVIDGVSVYTLTSATQDPEAGTLKLEEDITAGEPTYAYEYDATLNAGYNYFVMNSESDYGLISAPSNVYSVFYDDNEPEISSIKISQDAYSSYGGTASKTGDDFVVDNKVTRTETTKVEVEVKDLQLDNSDGSGIDTVTINGKDASYDKTTGIATYEISPDVGNDGKNCNWPVVVKDKAGREISKNLKFKFFKEDAEVTLTEKPANTTSDNHHFYIWNDPSNKNAYIEATIKTEVPLTSIIISDGTTSTDYINTPDGPDSSGIYTYKCKYTFDTTVSKADYKVSLVTTSDHNINTTKELAEFRSIDITNPDDADVSGTKNWTRKLILTVKVNDQVVSSGIKEIKATGTDKSTYTVSGSSGTFTAEVNKSKNSSGTPVKFTVYDKAGNKSKEWAGTFYVDPDNPTVGLTVGGIDADKVPKYFDSDPVIKYSASDAISGCADTDGRVLKINDKTYDFDKFNGSKLSQIVGTLSETTTYTVEVIAKDKAGNTVSKKCSFKVDSSKPKASIDIETDSVKNNGYYNKTVQLNLTVSDSNIDMSDIKVYDANDKEVKVKWIEKDGKYTTSYKVSSEGKHVSKLVAKDKAGITASVSKKFFIDKTKPKLTTFVNDDEYEETDDFFDGDITTTVSVSDKYEDEKDVKLSVTRSPFNGSKETTSSKKGKGPHKFANEGKYKFTYTVTDLAGNETSKSFGVTIDKTKPVFNMYVKTDKPAKFKKYSNAYINKQNRFTARSDQESYRYGQYYNTDVVIELNYFEYNVDELSVYDYNSRDGMETELEPAWSKNTNGYAKATITISDEGYHKVRIAATDMAGNTTEDRSADRTIRFTIDKTIPTIATSLNGSGYSEGSGIRYLTGSATVGVSVSDENKDVDDLTRTLIVTAPGGGGKTTSVEKVGEGSEGFNGDSDYEVQYEAVDKAGNKSATRTLQFRVDKLPPELSITSTASSGASASAVTVTFNIKEPFFNDVTSSTIEVYKKSDGSAESHLETINFMPKSANDSMSKTYSEDGEYRFVFTAEDKTGNKANTDYTFILDGNKPIITLSGVQNYDKTDKDVELGVQVDETFYLSNKVVLSGTKTDIDGKKTNIDFERFPAAASKISSLKHMFKEDGIYDINVESTDRAGNTDRKNVHFTIDTTAPIIANLEEYDGTTVNKFVLDTDLDSLVKDLTVCDIKVYLDGVPYDGVTDLEDGSHTIRLEATDELGHKSFREYTFVLDTKGPTIIVSGVEEGDRLTDATDITVGVQLDDDTLEFVKLNGGIVNVSSNSSKLTVNKRGNYKLEASARDAAGNKSSVEVNFTYGTVINWLLICIIAGAFALLVLILVLLLKRKKSSN